MNYIIFYITSPVLIGEVDGVKSLGTINFYDGIIKGKSDDCDIAIFELPHGTIGLLNNLDIKIGLLTNIAEDHLSEFGGSLEKYQQRKLILERMSETFIANYSCFDIINPQRDDALYYALDKNVDFKGTVGDESLTIEYNNGNFTTPFYMMSYFFENSVAASAVALTYGVKKEDIVMMCIYSPKNHVVSPCGACRQVMSELIPSDCEVILAYGESVKKLIFRSFLT